MATTDLLENRSDVDDAEQSLPILQPWVVLSDLGGNQYVVKDSRTHFYFEAGPEEFFILQSLTHEVTLSELHQAYRERFGQAVEQGDLDDFLGMLSRRGLITKANELRPGVAAEQVSAESSDILDDDPNEEAAGPKRRWGKGSIFYYRVPLVNPDRLLTLVASTVPWVWTKGFLIASLSAMAAALLVMLANRSELIASFNASLRWDTLILVWVTTLFVTALHELAHGATCKKFGGEVRESGLLFIMLMPCLYVNVSDAWLVRERYKRLLITAAGGYMDLCLWCIAVYVWRITLPGTLINHLSFVVLSTCGARGLINFNPLLRLDGYYLLSDYLRIPNLYAQGRNYWMKHLAWVLWGGPRPESLPNGKLLFCYGLISWIFALIFMNVVLINIFSYISLEFGLAGLAFGTLLLTYAFRRVFRGFIGAEFLKMLQVRFGRSVAYIIAIVSLVTGMFYIPFQYYTVGDFEVRPSDCVDIPVPLDCFISRVLVEDGQLVKQGTVLVELRAPDLLSQLETKQAELRESEANLMRLKAGPRPEEIADQESRVQRLSSWCKLGRLEVETTQNALTHQLEALEHRIKQARTELEHAEKAIQLSERLADQGALAEAQLDRERTRLKILQERVSEVESERSVKATEGIRLAIAELSRREQELADAEGKLSLLRLGSRPEEIAAEEARRQRLVQELEFLNEQKARLSVVAPAEGYVSAARLREKVGSYSAKGMLLCQIERPGQRRVEVFVPEDDAISVQPGQPVTLKARALPLQNFHGEVERIAPAANKPEQAVAAKQLAPQQTVVVHCRVDAASGQLKSGMTGFARVFRGWSTLGEVLQLKAYKYLRTEFWW